MRKSFLHRMKSLVGLDFRSRDESTSTRFSYHALEPRQVLTAILFDAGTGILRFNGNSGNDVVIVHEIAGELRVDATGNVTQTFDPSDVTSFFFSAGSGDDRFTNNSSIPLQAYGHSGNDIIEGGTGNDFIHGGLGDDTISGGDGADTIRGGGGVDQIFGGFGNDSLFGGNGNDVIRGEHGNDRLFGERDDDILYGGAGRDILMGFTGADQLYGGDDVDLIFGQAGDDFIYGEDGADRLRGSSGADTIFGGAGNDFIFGNEGDDVLNGEEGSDFILGASGNDQLNGGAGTDRLFGQEDDDTIDGGDGVDVLRGGQGDDHLSGSADNDRIFGEEGNDRLYGHGGIDLLRGGPGNDSLFGGDSSTPDWLTGGEGFDRFLTQNRDSVQDYQEGDARLVFVDETDVWLDKEIEVLDGGFQRMFDRTESNVLLNDSVPIAGDLTFHKYDDLGESAAVNAYSYTTNGKTFFSFDREIRVADWDETSDFYNNAFAEIIIHEIGHNWDEEIQIQAYSSSLEGQIDAFRALSGWTATDQTGNSNYTQSHDEGWWYLSNSYFAADYGRTNPFEDLATTWEYYFENQSSSDHGDMQSKFDWLDNFFDLLMA